MGNGPTLAGFRDFITNQMGISSTVLPPSSPVIQMAYNVALQIVNQAIQYVSCEIYALTVYNLAGSNVINFAQDQPNALPIQGSNPPLAFFAYYRKLWNINGFVSGVVAATGDESDSVSLVVPEAAKNFTLADLQYLKDPYGRQYLAFAQRYGGIVGLT